MTTGKDRRAMARYRAVCVVLAHKTAGRSLAAAIHEVTKLTLPCIRPGQTFRPRRRSLYRWVAAFEAGGIEALADKHRPKKTTRALSEDFKKLLVSRKTQDPEASIPDIIRSAEQLKLPGWEAISRTTAWRFACWQNLPLLRARGKDANVKRRFAFPHRMQMLLCDGKHFRAGAHRRKRLVFSFLDDSSRYVLLGVVDTSEKKLLFLRGVYLVLRRYGWFDAIFLDNGPGFIAGDVEIIMARLGIALIHGTEGYAEGHGKIEAFNKTLQNDLLRTFAGDPRVDPKLSSLEMRINHYMKNMYNKKPHEGIAMVTPEERWLGDSLPLRPIDDIKSLEQHFVITKRRKVAPDNVVMIERVPHDLPGGYAGRVVDVEHDLIGDSHWFLHDGKRIRLHPTNLSDNARTKRSKKACKALEETPLTPVTTAARLAFEQDFAPIVNEYGDFPETPDKE